MLLHRRGARCFDDAVNETMSAAALQREQSAQWATEIINNQTAAHMLSIGTTPAGPLFTQHSTHKFFLEILDRNRSGRHVRIGLGHGIPGAADRQPDAGDAHHRRHRSRGPPSAQRRCCPLATSSVNSLKIQKIQQKQKIQKIQKFKNKNFKKFKKFKNLKIQKQKIQKIQKIQKQKIQKIQKQKIQKIQKFKKLIFR